MINEPHSEPEPITNETRQAEDKTSAYEFKTPYQSKAEQFNAEVIRNSREIRKDDNSENEVKHDDNPKKPDSHTGLQTLKLLLIGHV